MRNPESPSGYGESNIVFTNKYDALVAALQSDGSIKKVIEEVSYRINQILQEEKELTHPQYALTKVTFEEKWWRSSHTETYIKESLSHILDRERLQNAARDFKEEHFTIKVYDNLREYVLDHHKDKNISKKTLKDKIDKLKEKENNSRWIFLQKDQEQLVMYEEMLKRIESSNHVLASNEYKQKKMEDIV